MPQPHDPLYDALNQLSIAPPPAMAQANILRAARNMPRKGMGGAWLLRWLRLARAYWWLPRTRFVVMASILALCIGLGTLQQFQRAAVVIPRDLMLYDVAFAEFDGTI